jgi:pSer/pThr/pTyr-binding forkhead associated (FHA) protein
VGLDGPVQDREFPLDRPELSIGRHESCEIVIPDRSVSRVHARIHTAPGEFLIEDAGSANGTWVNGVRLTGLKPLVDRDVIRVGNIGFSFEPVSPSAAVPPGAMTVVADLGSDPSPFGSAVTPVEPLPPARPPTPFRAEPPYQAQPPSLRPPLPAAAVPSDPDEAEQALRRQVSELKRDLDPFIRRLQALADSAEAVEQRPPAARQLRPPGPAALRELVAELDAIGGPEDYRELTFLLDSLYARPADPALLRRLSDQIPRLSRLLNGYLRALSLLRELARGG